MMTKTEKKALAEAVKTGFTYAGDAIFSSHAQAIRAINSLTKKGLLVRTCHADGSVDYRPTEQALEEASLRAFVAKVTA